MTIHTGVPYSDVRFLINLINIYMIAKSIDLMNSLPTDSELIIRSEPHLIAN